ncbi:hypothetical protein JW905_14225 [bacterium]|nr:hypothetical protein [candidate division CSSED10-310 bacterium]
MRLRGFSMLACLIALPLGLATGEGHGFIPVGGGGVNLGAVSYVTADPASGWWLVAESESSRQLAYVDRTGRAVLVPDPPFESAVNALAFDGKAGRIVSATDGGLWCCDLSTMRWQRLGTLAGVTDLIWHGGRLLAAVADGIVSVEPDGVHQVATCEPGDHAFSQAGNAVLVLTRDQGLLELLGDEVNRVTEKKQRSVFKTAGSMFTTDEGESFVVSEKGLWRLAGGKLEPYAKKLDCIAPLVMMSAEERIWYAALGGGLVLKEGDVEQRFTTASGHLPADSITGLATSYDDEFLLVGTSAGAVVVETTAAARLKSVETVTDSCYRLDRPAGSMFLATRIALPRSYDSIIQHAFVRIQLPVEEGVIVEPILEQDVYGNQQLLIPGDYAWLSWHSMSLEWFDKTNCLRLDLAAPVPMLPGPVESLPFVQPLPGMPAPDTVVEMAVAEVAPESRGDALKICRDLIYSRYFTDPTVTVPGVDLSNPRMRLHFSVALLRSLGLPARLVTRDLERCWGEVWFNDIGWVPYDVGASPLAFWRDYRTQCPAPRDELHVGVQRIAARDEIPGFTVLTNNQVPPRVKRLELYETETDEAIQATRLLVVAPASRRDIRDTGRITFSERLSGIIHSADSREYLALMDDHGMIVLDIPLANYDRAQMLSIPNECYLQFIPSVIADWFIMRTMRWELNPAPLTPESMSVK